jgi:glycosyltransferase 2 family protein
VVSLLIAAGFVWLMQRGGLPMLPPEAAWNQLASWAIPTYFAIYCAHTFFRTWRWLHLLRAIEPALSARYAWGASLAGFAAVVFAPLRMGEMMRPWLISRRGEVRFLQAVGSVGAERIVDGLLLMSVLAVGLGFSTRLSPAPDKIGDLQVPVALVPAIASSALTMFAVAFAGMAAFYFFRDSVRRITYRVLSIVSDKFANWVIAQLERVSDGLSFLPSRQHGGAFLRHSILYWALTWLGNLILLRGCGIPAGPAQAAVIMGVLGLGTLLPSGPGFFGTYQLGAYCGLAMFFPENVVLQAGAVFTFVSYTAALVVTILAGLLGMRLMSSAPRR